MKALDPSFGSQKIYVFLFVCVLLLAGCGQVTVSQDYDSAFDFQTNKSFTWDENAKLVTGDLLQENDLLLKRFQTAIFLSLEQKGYHRISTVPALLVSCNYTVVTKFETEPYNTGVAMGVGRYGHYGGFGFGSGTYVNQYDQGRLTVNLHDSGSGKLVWTGLATRVVNQHYTPSQYDELVKEFVTELMSKFPPQ